MIILPLRSASNNEGTVHFRVFHDAQTLCSAKRRYFSWFDLLFFQSPFGQHL